MGKAIADSTGGVIYSIDSVHYAVMEEDKKTGVKYGEIIPLPNAKSITINANDQAQTGYYDGEAKVIVVAKGEKTVTFAKSDFSDEDKAAFLGCKIIDGILVESGDDIMPYIALGFRLVTTKGHRYYWLPKGMMRTPTVTGSTKEQTVTLQDQTIEGNFIARSFDSAMSISKHVTGAEDTDEFMSEWFSAETLLKKQKKESIPTPP